LTSTVWPVIGAAESGLALPVAEAPAGVGVGAVDAESMVEVFFSPPHAASSTAQRAIGNRVMVIPKPPGFLRFIRRRARERSRVVKVFTRTERCNALTTVVDWCRLSIFQALS
jgi:hypothetical protein